MSKTVIFSNTTYELDEAKLAQANESVVSFLTTELAGTGATVKFNGVTYEVDSTKLNQGRTELVEFLSTIEGEGEVIEIDGVEYSVASSALEGATATVAETLVNLGVFSEGLEYELNEDGVSYSVISIGTCTDIDVVIPIKYEGLPVTELKTRTGWVEEKGELYEREIGTFENCSNLTSITIPDSVTSIGRSAFARCFNLTSVYITDIAKWCAISFGAYSANPLYHAENLYLNGTLVTDLEIPNSVTSIGSSAFAGCTSLTSITIPDSVTSIGDDSFRSCDSLTSVTIGNSVMSIGNSAFNSCSSLTSITIPDSVTSIGRSAFNSCSSLTSITIPDSVTSIGRSAFEYCDSLTSVYYDGDIASWCNISFGSPSANPVYYANNLYIKKSETNEYELLTNLIIPDSVTEIKAYAFYNCSSLTNITIPSSVTSIGSSAFRGCSKLTSVTIPFVGATRDGTSNTHFGYIFGASYYSYNKDYVPESLKEVIITGGTSIDSYAFYECTNLTSVTIPNSVTSIGGHVFNGCTSLASITIPNSVTSMVWGAFNCSSLANIYINKEEGSLLGSPWGANNATVHWNSTGPDAA